jgi:TrmH family RNA methyltransferase
MLCGADLVHELGNHVEVSNLFHLSDNTKASQQWEAVSVAVSESVMKKITGLETVPATMLAAEIEMPKRTAFETWEVGSIRRLLVLDRCQDPGNLGTLLRSAVAFDWDGIFLLSGCADHFNDKCIRASRGAPFRIPIGVGTHEDWEEICSKHQLLPIAADMEDRSMGSVLGVDQALATWSPSSINIQDAFSEVENARISLTVGSEGQGISEAMRRACVNVAIPMPGQMESLNVGAAASILMCMLSPIAGPRLMHNIYDVVHRE